MPYTETGNGRSVASFENSIRRPDQELPNAYRQQLFAIALGDVAADNDVGGYSDEDYRAQLDGLTYGGVIDLADQAGPPVRQQYYAGRYGIRRLLEAGSYQQRLAAKTAPYFPPPPSREDIPPMLR